MSVLWGTVIRERKEGTIVEFSDGTRIYFPRIFLGRLMWVLTRRKDYDAPKV